MKKNLLCLFIILVLCTGCPYESAIPIDKPKVMVDKALLGIWKDEDARGEPDNYDVRKADDFTFIITENTYSKEDRSLQQKRYSAFVSVVDGASYMNIKMIKDSVNITVSDNYLLYKIELKDKKLKLLPLSKYIKEQFDNSVDLQNFIKKYQNLSFFYGDHSSLVKVND